MTAFTTTPEQQVEVYKIAAKMSAKGLSAAFVAEVVQMAVEYEGALELMQLWNESCDQAEQDEIIADLQEETERLREFPSEPFRAPRINFDDLGKNVEEVLKFKKELREVVDSWGGISKLSSISGIPQPSLSRFFSSASFPRNTTIYRIVNALLSDERNQTFRWSSPVSINDLNARIWEKKQEIKRP